MNKLYFVDFENLQDLAYEEIDPNNDMVVIFVGHAQTKISFDIVKKTQKLGKAVEWIQMGGSGRNSLDFHIAYYLGYFIASKESTSTECKIFIASGDSDYDVLIKHILSQGHYCERVKSIPNLTKNLQEPVSTSIKISNQNPDPIAIETKVTPMVTSIAPSPTVSSKALSNNEVLVHLLEMLATVDKLKRPRTETTLINFINSRYLKKKPDLKPEEIFNLLRKFKKITLNQKRISYQF
ncbi:PIN domain-containing protein [Chitinibacter sp. GC72]|uniref:PIN domain-containing protein n=1 Tax=Chitinibacter sp. GC72 TaxID=1526917 RepID=UPI0012F85C07|nr:PIN domain-containing protein [Chitinibacter sp. GC72]